MDALTTIYVALSASTAVAALLVLSFPFLLCGAAFCIPAGTKPMTVAAGLVAYVAAGATFPILYVAVPAAVLVARAAWTAVAAVTRWVAR